MTTLGKIRYWKIGVIEVDNEVSIVKEYGQRGGKAITNIKIITETKSQSSPFQQAVFEAKKDRQDMQDKKGYVLDLSQLTNVSTQLKKGASAPASASASASASADVKPLIVLKGKPAITMKQPQPQPHGEEGKEGEVDQGGALGDR